MEYVSGNIFIREMEFPQRGDVVHGHTHNFDHTTYVVRGALQIESLREVKPAVLDDSGQLVELAQYETIRTVVKRASDGHNWVLIRAGVCHRLTALEDRSMGHCIYSHRNGQSEIVQEYDGWTHGYL